MRIARILADEGSHLGDNLLALRIALRTDGAPRGGDQLRQLRIFSGQQLADLVLVECGGSDLFPADRLQELAHVA
jgi:hypothetical protein